MDLLIAVLANAGMTMATGWCGGRLARRCPESVAPVLLLASLLGLLLAAKLLKDRLFWAAWFPVPSVGTLCNPVGPSAAFVAVVVGHRLGRTPERRRRLAWFFGIAGFIAAYAGSFGAPPPISDRAQWQDGVLQQSTPATCGAASAVTLLRQAGIASTEREMARLCNTTGGGTAMLDLYRGLTIKTRGTRYRPVALTVSTIAELRRVVIDGPVLISVLFQPAMAQRATRWHMAVGAQHAVVILGFLPDGRVIIGDPLNGRTLWSEEEFLQRWVDEGIQIRPVRRQFH